MGWFTKPTPVVVNIAPSKCERIAPQELVTDGCWISVREQIPEYHVRVLVYDTSYGVLTGERTAQDSGGDTWRLGLVERNTYSIYPMQVTSKSVTHWRPVPAAP